MDKRLPNAKSARLSTERAKIRRVVARRGLAGLANDTKWDKLIDAVRAHEGWRPSYRYKCVDGPPSGWDVEWFHHLPFPLISVEWLDIAYHGGQRPRGSARATRVAIMPPGSRMPCAKLAWTIARAKRCSASMATARAAMNSSTTRPDERGLRVGALTCMSSVSFNRANDVC